MASRLRPRGISELIDVLFALVREHYLAFITITAIGFFPIVVIVGLYYAMSPSGTAAVVLGTVGALVGGAGILVAQGALIHAGSDAYLHDTVDVERSLRQAAAQMPTTFTAYLLSFVIVGVGYLLLIIPGVYASGAVFALPAIALLEGRGPGESVSRAFELSKGRKVAILGALMLTSFVAGALRGVLGMFGGLAGETVGIAVQVAAFLALHPLTTLMVVLLYYDTRIRAEAFDLEFDAQSLGGPGAPAAI